MLPMQQTRRKALSSISAIALQSLTGAGAMSLTAAQARQTSGPDNLQLGQGPERGPYTLDPDGTLHGPAGTHNIQDVPEGCCPICAGTGYANQDTRELCHTCGGTGAD